MNLADRLPAGMRPWYQAARPRSLPATYAPLFLAGAILFGENRLDVFRYILALTGALLLQIASNFINEYVDYRRGTDAQKVDGMGMVLSRAELAPRQVLTGSVVTVLGGALIGMYLAATSGPLLLWIGLFGVLVVITYTAGPLPLAYLGLGEIAVFLAFGPLMVLGAYYAVSGRESWLPVLASLPLACTVSGILHANNMRDLEADRAASKRTLAVRFGRKAAKKEFAILVFGAYASTAGLVLLGWMPWPALMAFITLPEAIDLVRLASSSDDPKVLHRAQGLTARLHFRLGLALTVGWLVSALVPSFTR